MMTLCKVIADHKVVVYGNKRYARDLWHFGEEWVSDVTTTPTTDGEWLLFHAGEDEAIMFLDTREFP